MRVGCAYGVNHHSPHPKPYAWANSRTCGDQRSAHAKPYSGTDAHTRGNHHSTDAKLCAWTDSRTLCVRCICLDARAFWTVAATAGFPSD